MAPKNNVLLNNLNKSNISLANNDSPFLPKTPASLNKNTASLSDSIKCGAEINKLNTTTEAIPCNNVQSDSFQVNSTSPRNNENPSTFKTPTSLNGNNASLTTIEIPSSKQAQRNSHNDCRNKTKILTEQSNKNESSNPNIQAHHGKKWGKTPKRYTPCPFLRRRGWCAKGNQCDFMHPKPVQHEYQTLTPYPFTQRDGLSPIRNCHFSCSDIHHEIYNQAPFYPTPFLSHRRRPMTPVPLMDILVQPPPFPFPRHY